MRLLASILRSRRCGAILLAMLLLVSIGVPAVATFMADGSQPGDDGPSVGVLSTAAIGGLHRLLLGESSARPILLEAATLAILVVDSPDRPAGISSAEDGSVERGVVSHGPTAPLRV